MDKEEDSQGQPNSRAFSIRVNYQEKDIAV